MTKTRLNKKEKTMDEIKAKQQVVEKIREAEKILVTVSDNPSVDALSAALGLSFLLEGQKKYATAIFSGETPPAIAFLKPEQTFDDTTDSLRDFIIALDTSKADHLRMPKPEPGDSKVRIFVTPYKTVLTEKDLEFSQGDYNVELVIALGVDSQENLDEALDNHGKILHDATIITMTAGEQTSDLGGIDWHDSGASSLSEMVAGLVEALKEDKKKSLLDGPIATALLTGIVAQTDRFSNEHTTSKAMTVAATLMAAGADQQLIANELESAEEISEEAPVEVVEENVEESTTDIEPEEPVAPSPDQGVRIDHTETLAELDERVRGEEAAQDKIDDEREAHERVIAAEAEAVEPQATTPGSAYAASPTDVAVAGDIPAPSFGGTLNATTDQAEETARREEEGDKNRTILSHANLSGNATANVNQFGESDEPASVDIFNESDVPAPGPNAQSYMSAGERVIQPLSDPLPVAPTAAQSVLPPLAPEPMLEQVSAPEVAPLQSTEPAAPNAYGITPSLSDTLASALDSASPVPQAPVVPGDLGLPLPPPLPDFGAGMPPAFPPVNPAGQPGILGDILTQDTSEYVDPTANTVAAAGSAYAFEETPAPGVPVEQPMAAPAQVPQPVAPVAPVAPPNPADPAQYQIPSQQ